MDQQKAEDKATGTLGILNLEKHERNAITGFANGRTKYGFYKKCPCVLWANNFCRLHTPLRGQNNSRSSAIFRTSELLCRLATCQSGYNVLAILIINYYDKATC